MCVFMRVYACVYICEYACVFTCVYMCVLLQDSLQNLILLSGDKGRGLILFMSFISSYFVARMVSNLWSSCICLPSAGIAITLPTSSASIFFLSFNYT